MSRPRLTLALLTAGLLVTAGCTGAQTDPVQAPSHHAPQGPTGPADRDDADDAQIEPGNDQDPDPVADPVPDDELPGEPLEFFHGEGDLLDVIGVEADDVLYVREVPDPQAEVVTELDPLAEAVQATGRSRQLAQYGIWSELEINGHLGWANTAYLGYLGGARDQTSDFEDLAPQTSMADLGTAVSERVVQGASDDGVAATVVGGPHEGDLIELVIDLLGNADDSGAGSRLSVFANIADGEYELFRVDVSDICTRGVSGGICV